ncbi:MAG TPA: FAD-dependent oxidoreductase [Syntrophomonadaceae bacterium]|nr:FAD-dependent oxidoreductase [Syntrophomonadaceae bacterium]HPU48968.1 FAD-dependent oxidoreductase [Syntrophomonadaceae bacterium]
MKYVIIGNGIAAAGAVEGIRSRDRESPIAIIDGEQRGSYSRPLITYYLAGKRKAEQMHYRPPAFFHQQGVTVIPDRAVKIDNQTRQVILQSGLVVGYDRLLLATGASPIIPEIPGIRQNGCVKTLYTWQDAEQLDLLVTPGQRAVVMGSGLIGIKAAEALYQRGMQVTIIEKQTQILPRLLSRTSAELVKEHLQDKGIEIITGQEVTRINGDNGVELADGRILTAQLVIVAIGTRPNLSLAADCGLAVNQGVLVDSHLRTSDANIFAAGDVIETNDILTGYPAVMALLPLAHREGFLAGQNMAGAACSYPGGLLINSVHVLGMNIIGAGSPQIPGQTWLWQQGNHYLELVTESGRLVRYIALNMPQVTGPLTSLIEKQMEIQDSLWQEFISQPGLNRLPPMYWEAIKEVADNDSYRCRAI